ncbi:unnamed protein product [Rangifer tarandus platyrhynchus]|uniref:Uncharacterized protein n=1 Tax=Rangifer tarandus platyrhynchus TaxID=3082113 RepID=A0ABN8XMP8_RANTA|nr:unnamed protein product [Rangifer tarandus platyrhynchus]
MGAQGPGCAPPMPEGGSEDRGPRSAAGPNQTPPGPRGPEPRTGPRHARPTGPLGVPETLRAPGPGQVCWPGLPVCGDWEASAGLPALAGAPRGKVRPAVDTAHQSEKQAQRRVFKGAWRQPPPSKIIPP